MALSISPGETKLGWIGLGVMGSSMCGHLIDKGFAATVYTRTRSKADPLVAKGATWVDSPRAVAEQADVIFSIVGFPSDVREVMLGDSGAFSPSSRRNAGSKSRVARPSMNSFMKVSSIVSLRR